MSYMFMLFISAQIVEVAAVRPGKLILLTVLLHTHTPHNIIDNNKKKYYY